MKRIAPVVLGIVERITNRVARQDIAVRDQDTYCTVLYLRADPRAEIHASVRFLS